MSVPRYIRTGYAMQEAQDAMHLSTAPNRKVGCVLWTPERILVVGANMSLPNTPTCAEGCWDVSGNCMRNEHAESMCVATAARHGIQLNGAYACVTEQPCIHCARIMAFAGISRVWWLNESDYIYVYTSDMIQHVGLITEQYISGGLN